MLFNVPETGALAAPALFMVVRRRGTASRVPLPFTNEPQDVAGAPSVTPSLSAVAQDTPSRERQRPAGRAYSPHTLTNMPNQPSFAERCQLLRETANRLKEAAEIVALEAVRMSAAEKRFSERKKPKASR